MIKEKNMHKCQVCNNTNSNKPFVAREMMFGYRDEFEYFECFNCGCLQIVEIPPDLSKYYPSNYYSLTPSRESLLKKYLKFKRAAHVLGKKNIIGKLLVKRYGAPPYVEWFKHVNVSFDNAILEVGSGTGRLLLDMRRIGFLNLTGVDPYIERDLNYNNGVRIVKRDLSEVDGNYDFVMLHHVFEHLADPVGTLHDIHRLLKAGCFTLIRTPIAGSYAWHNYGTNWVQLDAPRHLIVHTENSIQILAEQTGFEVAQVIYDSTAFQFWASEQYRQDISLRDNRSYYENPGKSIFSQEEIQEYITKAKHLNQQKKGDQACFYLCKV